MPWTIDIPHDIRQPDTASAYGRRSEENQSGLAELSEFYRQLGFDAGYAQAARDQLELSVVIAEQVLREQRTALDTPKDARRLLYAFIARVERRLGLLVNSTPIEANDQCNDQYMEGGMGI